MDGSAHLDEVRTRLEGLIDWERRERAPGERGQAMRVDLEPIEDLASLCGRPDKTLTVVHVAGSKGKGSVASLVAAAMVAAGLRVGRYGSPHVERLNERIELDGEPIEDGALADALEQALDAQFYTEKYSALANLGWAYYGQGDLVGAMTELRGLHAPRLEIGCSDTAQATALLGGGARKVESRNGKLSIDLADGDGAKTRAAAINRKLNDAGIDVHHLTIAPWTLEELFLQLVGAKPQLGQE